MVAYRETVILRQDEVIVVLNRQSSCGC